MVLNKLPLKFKNKIEIDNEGCFIWTAGRFKTGYGAFWYRGKQLYAHRFAWQCMIGAIPPKMVLDHYRMNPGPRQAPCSKACVNTEHLEIVTHAENSRRGKGGAAAAKRQLAKTHCGTCALPYAGVNLYVTTKGYRACRSCKRKYQQIRNARMKENK